MTEQPRHNPRPPEHINNRHEHPLKDFLVLAGAAIVSIMLITWLLASSASWLAPKIPYAWESKWLQGDEATELSKEEQALTQLLDKLIEGSALPTRIHYLSDEEMPNAFATLGGHIFVTRGLLENVSSENALGMVLAHEYAHVALRHPITAAFEQLSVSLVMSLLGADNVATAITQNTALFTMLSFSRDMERASDNYALERLQAVYGHSAGAEEFFETIQKMENESVGEDDHKPAIWRAFTHTHPLTAERLDNIRSRFNEGQVTPLPNVLQVTRDTVDES